jgi:hypothetical protein
MRRTVKQVKGGAKKALSAASDAGSTWYGPDRPKWLGEHPLLTSLCLQHSFLLSVICDPILYVLPRLPLSRPPANDHNDLIIKIPLTASLLYHIRNSQACSVQAPCLPTHPPTSMDPTLVTMAGTQLACQPILRPSSVTVRQVLLPAAVSELPDLSTCTFERHRHTSFSTCIHPRLCKLHVI